MRFSLILATINRTKEIQPLLDSLNNQTYRDFELIVIDQNKDASLTNYLRNSRINFQLKILYSAKGLSRARNIGLKQMCGEIVAFPDDDCWYPNDLLNEVECFFRNNASYNGLSGSVKDRNNADSVIKQDLNSGEIDPQNIWKRSTSISIFFSRRAIEKIGLFDETLGVGAGTPWGSGEDIDYILRGIEAGLKIYYKPSLVVYHPQVIDSFDNYDEYLLKKAVSYAAGIGRLLKKHRYKIKTVMKVFGQHFLVVLHAVIRLRLKKAWLLLNTFYAKLKGYYSKVA